MIRRRYRWRGPQPATGEEQVANACDWFPNLTPVSVAPALQVQAGWAATLPGEVPFVWERDRGGDEEVC